MKFVRQRLDRSAFVKVVCQGRTSLHCVMAHLMQSQSIIHICRTGHSDVTFHVDIIHSQPPRFALRQIIIYLFIYL